MLALGRSAEAAACVRDARAVAEAIQARRRLWHILATLADVEEVQGNEGIALNLHHEARTTLEVIIDHIPEGEVQASFVGVPGVAAMVGADS